MNPRTWPQTTSRSERPEVEAAQVVFEDEAVRGLQVADLPPHLVEIDGRAERLGRARAERIELQGLQRHVGRHRRRGIEVRVEQPLHVGVARAGEREGRPPERRPPEVRQ